MKINSEIIRGVLAGMLSGSEPIIHRGMTYQLSSIVSRITVGLNDIIAKGEQMEHLKREQVALDAKHIEATGEIEDKMARLQEECPHFSFHEVADIVNGRVICLAVCDICGKILEETDE
jgi:hypothetical protein